MFIGKVPNIVSTFGSLKCLSITLLIQHSILLQNLVTFSHSRKAWTTVSSLLQNKYVDESAKFILRRILLVITLLYIILKCISLENVPMQTRKLLRKVFLTNWNCISSFSFMDQCSWIFCKRLSFSAFHAFLNIRRAFIWTLNHW